MIYLVREARPGVDEGLEVDRGLNQYRCLRLLREGCRPMMMVELACVALDEEGEGVGLPRSISRSSTP